MSDAATQTSDLQERLIEAAWQARHATPGMHKWEKLFNEAAAEIARSGAAAARKDKALRSALAWDHRRNFIMPYSVRDPIRDAIATPEHKAKVQTDVQTG